MSHSSAFGEQRVTQACDVRRFAGTEPRSAGRIGLYLQQTKAGAPMEWDVTYQVGLPQLTLSKFKGR